MSTCIQFFTTQHLSRGPSRKVRRKLGGGETLTNRSAAPSNCHVQAGVRNCLARHASSKGEESVCFRQASWNFLLLSGRVVL